MCHPGSLGVQGRASDLVLSTLLVIMATIRCGSPVTTLSDCTTNAGRFFAVRRSVCG